MSRRDKLLKRFLSKPKDFTWDELCKLLNAFGYEEVANRKTGGSRRRFVHKNGSEIKTHEPHPRKIIKRYVIEEVLHEWKRKNML